MCVCVCVYVCVWCKCIENERQFKERMDPWWFLSLPTSAVRMMRPFIFCGRQWNMKANRRSWLMRLNNLFMLSYSLCEIVFRYQLYDFPLVCFSNKKRTLRMHKFLHTSVFPLRVNAFFHSCVYLFTDSRQLRCQDLLLLSVFVQYILE